MIEPLPAHGGQLRQLAERFGLPAAALLDFSANINPEGPPPGVLSALRESLADPAALTQYPDLDEKELRLAIARYAGAAPEQIVVANGFVPLLEASLRALGVRRCLLPEPCFREYRSALERARVEIVGRRLDAERDFLLDSESLRLEGEDAVLLANPQNPSGVLRRREELLEFAAMAGRRNARLLLDEAFIDYVPEDSLARDVQSMPNLIVFRSVTKFFGMPGIRAAYAAAHPDVARAIQECLAPWLIATLASRAVCAALGDLDYAQRARALNRERGLGLRARLDALGLRVYPSAANFLLFRLPGGVDATACWIRMIAEFRIVLRHCGNYPALPPGHLRAAVRRKEENDRLAQALASALH